MSPIDGHPPLSRSKRSPRSDGPAGGSAPIRVGHANATSRAAWLRWLDAGLRPERPGRLEAEYPLLLGEDSTAIPLTWWEDDTPLASCVLWPVDFRVAGRPLRVGLVSLVYTDPRGRGRGLARAVVDAACREAERRDLGMTLLWSNADRLYVSLGFVASGCETMLALDAETIDGAGEELCADLGAFTVRPGRARDWPEIERLRRDRPCGLGLSAAALERLASIPDLDLRVALDDEGLQGFAMRGRGDDFADVIHEWGGRPEAALAACRALVTSATGEDPTFLMGPPDRSRLGWALRSRGAAIGRRPLGWMRIASPAAFAADLAALLPAFRDVRVERRTDPLAPIGGSQPPRLRLVSPRGEATVGAKALLDAVFGSDDPSLRGAGLAELAGALGPEALTLAPLPFFVWGLESI